MKIRQTFREMSFRKAAGKGDLETVRRLAAEGVNIDAEGDVDGTALMLAAEKGHIDVVRFLVEKGAKLNVNEQYHGTALNRAIKHRHDEIALLLIEKGANVSLGPSYDCGAPNSLTAAAINGNTALINLLIDKGAPLEAKDSYFGTALLAAAEKGQVESVRVLINRGADVHSAVGTLGANGNPWYIDEPERSQIWKIFTDELAAEAADRAKRHGARPQEAAAAVSPPAPPLRKPPGFSL